MFYSFSIYLFIYLFRAAKFMCNINIIHRSFSPTALFPCLTGCLSFSLPCPACFLALPISSAFSLFPCPAYFCALPISLPCPFPCPAFFLALPTSVPCLFLLPTDLLFFYECMLHGYITSTLIIGISLMLKCIYTKEIKNLFLLLTHFNTFKLII